MRNILTSLLLIIVMSGCESKKDKISPIDTLHSEIDYYDVLFAKGDFEADSIIHDGAVKGEIIGRFWSISQRMAELKSLYYQTNNEVYRQKFNSMLPEYHRWGKQYNRLFKK